MPVPFFVKSKLKVKNTSADTYAATVENAAFGGDKTFILPAVTAASVTVAQITEAQTFAGAQTCSTSIASPSHIITNGAQKTTLTRSATAADYTLATQDRSGYVADLQNIQDAAADKPSYNFNVSTDKIWSTANISLGISPITTLLSMRLFTSTYTSTRYFSSLGAGVTATDGRYISDFGGQLQASYGDQGTAGKFVILGPLNTDYHTYGVVMDGSTITGYRDGRLVSTATGVTQTSCPDGLVKIGSGTVSLASQIFRNQVFNYALSADKIARYSAGAKLDWDDIGGSMTQKIIAAADYNFSSDTGHWVTNNAAAIKINDGGSGVMRFTAAGDLNYIYMNQSGNVTAYEVGKRYRFTYTVSNRTAGAIKIIADQNTDVEGTNVSANGNYTLDFTADSTATAITFLVTGTTTLDIDNVSVVQLGCVLDLEPEGITSTKWLDQSGNALDGTPSTTGMATNERFPVITHVPTLTSAGGTITTITVNSCRYSIVGKVVSLFFDLSIVDVGSSTGQLRVSLPTRFPAFGSSCGSVMEVAAVGTQGTAIITSSTSTLYVGLQKNDNTTFLVNGYRVIGSISYTF